MADWYLKFEDGSETGPISEADFKELIRTSVVKPDTNVRTSSTGTWATADKVKGIRFPTDQTQDKTPLEADTVPPVAKSTVKPQFEKVCPFCREDVKVDSFRCKHCNANLIRGGWLFPRYEIKRLENGALQKVFIALNKKKPPNRNTAAILGFLFGPLGMFYSTSRGALIMLVWSLFWGVISNGLVDSQVPSDEGARNVIGAIFLVSVLCVFATPIIAIVWAAKACSDNPRFLGNHLYE